MTTVSYDTKYLAADSAYTSNEITYTNIPFPKIHKINNTIFGMAGSLEIMINFTNQIKSPNFNIKSFLSTQNDTFAAIIHQNNKTIKVDKDQDIIIEDITNVPTTIGSGSYYSQNILQQCPDALVIVLQAIELDKYSKGKIIYYGLNCGINNLPKKENIPNINSIINNSFIAHKEFFHIGNPTPIPLEKGYEIINSMLITKKNYFYE